MAEGTFEDRHGVAVFSRRWAHASPVGCIVLSHGASEHSGRYSRFALALNEAGFAVYALDHRGHGGTAEATGRGRMGPPGGDALVDDLDHVVDRATADHPGTPVVLFGHSLGAVIALAYATRHAERLAGLVLSGFPASLATAAAFRDGFQGAVDAGMGDQPMASLSAYNEQFEPARTPFDWLSRDPDEVDAYLADPLCGDALPLTYGFLAALFSAVAPALTTEVLARISCPVLLVTGGRDSAAANGEHAHELATALRATGVPVESTEYSDARHELLNETNRDEVTADIVAWLRQRVAATQH